MQRFQKILFPVDFSERSQAAAPFVLSLAQRYGAKVALLHAIQPSPPLYAGMNTVYPETIDYSGIQTDMEIRLRQFAADELPKVECTCAVELGDPATVITEFAEAGKFDLIAMPTHGYGAFRRFLLGSVTAKVLHDSKAVVWTSAHAPEPDHRAHPKPRRIVTALDLKPESLHTLEAALEIAAESEATLEILHVAPEGEITPYKPEGRIQELLQQAASEVPLRVSQTPLADVEVVTDGNDVPKLIRELALRQRADLVVIGRGVMQGALGGFRTEAFNIIREAPCPVLSVP